MAGLLLVNPAATVYVRPSECERSQVDDLDDRRMDTGGRRTDRLYHMNGASLLAVWSRLRDESFIAGKPDCCSTPVRHDAGHEPTSRLTESILMVEADPMPNGRR
jgi:hypothetical protein